MRDICHLQNSHHILPLKNLEGNINDYPLRDGYVRYVMCRKGSGLSKGGTVSHIMQSQPEMPNKILLGLAKPQRTEKKN